MRLAQWIDGRICYLREALLAVVPERPGQARQKSGRSIVAHAPHGFLPLEDEWLKQQLVLVLGPTQGSHDALSIGRGRGRQLFRRNHVNKLGCRPRFAEFLAAADLRRTGQVSSGGFADQSVARAQALPFRDVLAVQIGDADFRTDHQQSAGCQRVA